MDFREAQRNLLKTTIPKKRNLVERDPDSDEEREFQEEERRKRMHAGGSLDADEYQETQATYLSLQEQTKGV